MLLGIGGGGGGGGGGGMPVDIGGGGGGGTAEAPEFGAPSMVVWTVSVCVRVSASVIDDSKIEQKIWIVNISHSDENKTCFVNHVLPC